MKNLFELHAMAGFPDLEHWRARKTFTLVEAALLVAGMDPLDFEFTASQQFRYALQTTKHPCWKWAFSVHASLIEAVCTQSLKSPQVSIQRWNDSCDWVIEQHNISIADIHHIIPHQTLISRESYMSWLRKEGFLDQKPLVVEQARTTEALPKLIGYSTPAMQCIQDVVREFWSDWKPGASAPKREVVLKWVEQHADRYGLDSDRKRQAIDLIARHPEAREQTQKKKGG